MGAFSRLFGRKESIEDRFTSQVALLAQLERGTERALQGVGEACPEERAFWRRTFVQYLFATVDAQLDVLRISSVRQIERRQSRVRRGGVHFLKPVDYKGREHEAHKDAAARQTSTLDIPSMFRIYAKSLLAERAPAFEGDGFRSFESFLGIRARIVHPRHPGDILLTDDCIGDCARAWAWFRVAIVEPCRALCDDIPAPRRPEVVSAKAA